MLVLLLVSAGVVLAGRVAAPGAAGLGGEPDGLLAAVSGHCGDDRRWCLCGISRGFLLVSVSCSHRVVPDHRNKMVVGRSSADDGTSGFPRNPRDSVAEDGAPGTRKQLVKAVPDRLERPQQPTGYPTLRPVAPPNLRSCRSGRAAPRSHVPCTRSSRRPLTYPTNSSHRRSVTGHRER